MAIVIGKLVRKVFENDNYHIYQLRVHGGHRCKARYQGDSPPKALKTVEYVLFGNWDKHPKYGKQFEIQRVERSTVQNQREQTQTRMLTDAKRALER